VKKINTTIIEGFLMVFDPYERLNIGYMAGEKFLLPIFCAIFDLPSFLAPQ
jgi:hypothetical protein